MVKIRLKRVGKRKQPSYRVVVADSRMPRDGRIIESIGNYQPRLEPSGVTIDNERALHWLKVGAQPSDQVRRLLEISGAWTEFTGKPVKPRRATSTVAPATAAAAATPAASVRKATPAASVADDTETAEEPEVAATPEASDQAPAAPEAVADAAEADEAPADEAPTDEAPTDEAPADAPEEDSDKA